MHDFLRHGGAGEVFGDMLPGLRTFRGGLGGILLHAAHQLAQVLLGRLRPTVAKVVLQIRLHALHFHQLVVQQVRVVRVHELRVRAPAGRDDRAAHRHRLVHRAAPAFAATRHHDAIRREVEARQVAGRDLLGEQLDAGQRFVAQPEARRELANNRLQRVARVHIRVAEEVGAEVQAHVIGGGELAQIRGQQRVPGLAPGPFKDGNEVELRRVG